MSTARSWLQRVLGRDEEALERLVEKSDEHERNGDLAAARERLESVLARQPGHAAALARLGHIADRQHRHEDAAAYFERASKAMPPDAPLCYALGISLSKLGQHAKAAAAFGDGLRLQRTAPLLNGRAAALIALGRLDEAEALLDDAMQLDPRDAGTLLRKARIALDRGSSADAIGWLRRAHELAPHDAAIHSALLFTLNYSEAPAASLFEEHLRFGHLQSQPMPAPVPDPVWPRRLRIGYLSPDFRSHVVATFVLPIVARHDREKFEVYCYSLGTETDEVTKGLRELADRWRECGGRDGAETAARIREDRIDILVDLAGHTMNNGLIVLAKRPAPLQVTYLGYPNTTGLPAVDSRITDARADPPGESDAQHTERLARLPQAFLCYRPGPGLEVAPLPAARRAVVTFGCFNNILKLSPAFLECAAQVLAAVPGSRLLLKDRTLGEPAHADAMRRRFSAAGIDPARLDLRGWDASPQSHLSAYADVDIALDSFPYAGTTTTCEALWMGVPVVSLRGDRHAARVGASLLETVGLAELVAKDPSEYVSLAARLAGNLDELAALRSGMRDRLRASPLLDEAGFVRHFEHCLAQLWETKLGEAPAKRDDAALDAQWNRNLDEGRFGAAIQAVGEAIAAEGESALRHYMLGCALQEAGRAQEAMESYRRALKMDPLHSKALNNLGCLLESAGDAAGAARCYDEAIAADPRLAMALANRGNLAKTKGDVSAAERLLRQAVELQPARADWQANLGDCLALQWKLDDAVAALRAAIALDPSAARAHFVLGNALVKLGRHEIGEAALRRAIELDPALSEAHSSLLFCLHYRLGDRPAELLAEHVGWAARHATGIRLSPPARRTAGDARLRIGYVSPDLRGHAVALFVAPLLASHDRSAFRIHCYASMARADAVTDRLRGLCDEWRQIEDLSDEAAADLIRRDGIDILVDLAGHSAGGRPLLFARKPAPVQVTWLGYPNTTGMRAVDFRLTDAWADPDAGAAPSAVEALLRLPRPFLCFSPPAEVAPARRPPALEKGHVTFGSFNNVAKITEEQIALWSAVLASVPGSRLMLKGHALAAPSARQRLAALFGAQGIGADRLKLLEAEQGVEAHLRRYAEVDIALDTFPYAGTTTTCEALWMGVPVVTRAGNSHVSRVGVSLLQGAGLPELIADSAQHYADIARDLALNLPRLSAMRAELRERFETSSLMDGPGFARSVEAAYRRMHEGGDALRLHVGGVQPRAGWKILNVQAGPGVDYVGDCVDLGRFADGSIEEVYASHVLEHLGYQSELPRTLKEFYRVLRPGGVARISVPDFERLCRLFLASEASVEDRFHVMRMVFGGQIDPYDLHRVGLTEEFLSHYLRVAGFSRVERVERFDLFDDASSLSVRGQLISLNVIAYK
jgi:predicted O-linked N-acetylglucosamine transferase (SPINDLY family)/predicted SAM-dependent methyltransferase